MRKTGWFLLVALLASAACVHGQEKETWESEIEKKLSKTVSFEFQDTTLSKALDFFRSQGELNLILDAGALDLLEKRLSLTLSKVRLESGIAWTARLMGLEYAVRDEAVFLAKRNDLPMDWRTEMQERYRRIVDSGQESWIIDVEARLDRTIKVEFRNDRLPAVLHYLAVQSGLNIVCDYRLIELDKPIKLRVEMSVRNVLKWVTRLAGVRYAIRDEVIYVAGAEALRGLRLETGESLLPVLFRRRVTFHFKDTPLPDALERLARHSDVRIRLEGLGPDEDLRITATGEQVELNRAVRAVMGQTGRHYAVSYAGRGIDIILSAKDASREERK